MPVENEFSDDGLGFLLTGLGIVTGQEILDAIAISNPCPQAPITTVLPAVRPMPPDCR
jgi:hypothetical protein